MQISDLPISEWGKQTLAIIATFGPDGVSAADRENVAQALEAIENPDAETKLTIVSFRACVTRDRRDNPEQYAEAQL